MSLSNENAVFHVTVLFGLFFVTFHYLSKEKEEHEKEILIIQRKMSELSSLCKEMKEEIKRIREEEKTVKRFISLSDLAHKNVVEENMINNDGLDYQDCIEQFADQFIDVYNDNKNNNDKDGSDVDERNRSNSLSSILGSAKKMVFG